MVYVQRIRQNLTQIMTTKICMDSSAKKKVSVEEQLEDAKIQNHLQHLNHVRKKDKVSVERKMLREMGRYVKKKKKRRGHLRGPAQVDDQTDRARALGDGKVGLALVGGGVTLDNLAGTLADGRAHLTGVVANLHTSDLHIGKLSNDAGDVPSGEAVVLLVAHVELTPGGGVLADVVSGETLALGGTPTTLRVVVDGDVSAVTGLDGEAESLVGGPETVQTTAGTVGVPHDNSPGLVVVVLEAQDVLVQAGGVFLDTDHVATPGAADVANVVPVEGADALAGSGGTEAIAGELAVGGEVGPVAGAGGTGGHGGRADAGDGLGSAGGLSGGGCRGSSSSGSGSRLGSGLRRGGGLLAEPVVDPGDELAVDGSEDLLTTLLDVRDLAGNGDSGLDIDVNKVTVGVTVAAFVAVKTSDSRPSGQRRHQQHGVGEVHFEELNELVKRVTWSENTL
jgi:hypothetical protein